MAKIFGLSGPQGGGKSTLLKGLGEKGMWVDSFKVSREVQKRLGWTTLEHAYDNAETMMKFQNMILEVKEEQERSTHERMHADDIVLTERTFADIDSYAKLWIVKLIEQGKWDIDEATDFMLPYTEKCYELQKLYVGNLVLPFMPHVKFEHDPNRAKQEDLKEFEDNLENFFMDTTTASLVPVYYITQESVEARVSEADGWIAAVTQ